MNYAEAYCRLARGSAGLVGRHCRRHRVDPKLGPRVRSRDPALRPLVRRRRAEHLLQLPRPPRRGRPRRPGRADLGQPDDRPDRDLHLSPAAVPHRQARRRPRRPRRRQGRPRGDLPADGARKPPSPCWPAPGSARSTPSCSAVSPRPNSPPASPMPSRRSSSPPPAASSPAAWSSTSRCSTPRSRCRRTSRTPA